MKQQALFTEIQPDVKYCVLEPNKASVIVHKFITTEDMKSNFDSDETQTMYEYEINMFSVNPSEITKEMIESNIEYYLEYTEENLSLEDKLAKLQSENEFLTQCIIEMSEVVYNG